ncbi:MAG TPA: Cof-type HAD-IIB family hydrolase [Candidatus Eisenbergiella merdipullorum]|uniref:Cof-type HAD-IIB family hydrolase n=1 Tax=Candidatus Eisenbergiella merdipullorum TaxID=2838553 RepID=A0A9D2I710_9FIRM|nr:Cof-type HAD-IIB family hydrolase [Candidatus Eisenbergiella merdipullorum]
MIKLIASDIDGTLIEESTPDLYPEMVQEIRRLTADGILFCAASGRQLQSVRNVFRDVADEICYIVENGALIHYRGENLAVTPMRREYVREITEQLRALGPGYDFVVSTPQGSLIETKNRAFLRLMAEGYRNVFRQVDDVLKEEAEVLKIAVYHEGSIRVLGESTLIPAWKDRVKVCMAGEEWVDFMDASVDKGNALSRLQKQFGILPEETMAFGDNSNDIGLMKAAVYSYAVENARPEVKAAARFVCPSYEQKGVWKVIHEMEEKNREKNSCAIAGHRV